MKLVIHARGILLGGGEFARTWWNTVWTNSLAVSHSKSCFGLTNDERCLNYYGGKKNEGKFADWMKLNDIVYTAGHEHTWSQASHIVEDWVENEWKVRRNLCKVENMLRGRSANAFMR
jgi:hypothetical protein